MQGWTHSQYRVKCRIARMEYSTGKIACLADYWGRLMDARMQHNLWRGRPGCVVRPGRIAIMRYLTEGR